MRASAAVDESSALTLPPIKGFLPNTLLDWPGKICAVLFLPGCKFRCPYCHARELVLDPGKLDDVSLTDVLENLGQHKDWIDGVVITGGEPLGQPHLVNLIEALRENGMLIKLDTNGSEPDALAALIDRGLLDYVAMDLKAPLDERYDKVAGVEVDLAAVTRSMELLLSGSVDYEFRTTYCPSLMSEEDVFDIARHLASAKRWFIQPFRPVNCLASWLETTERPSESAMIDLASKCRDISPNCRQRGRW